MSMYNFLMGENKDANALIGVLGLTKGVFGRYRDIYLNADGTKIIVYTRCGGDNRECYPEVFETMKKHPNYICDYDDNFDETYAYFEFSIPDKYKETCRQMATGEEPKTVDQKFKEHIAKMDDPDSEESKKAEILATQLMSAIEGHDDSDGNIHIFRI